MDTTRYNRLRRLVRGLNKSRREQAKKIDILCNDMVNVHHEFVQRLISLKFVVSFYEALLGCNSLTSVLNTAANLIAEEMGDANVAIFLLESDSYELHITDGHGPIQVHGASFESSFTTEVVQNISAAGRVFTLEDMYDSGLVVEKAEHLPDLCAAAVPLRRVGSALGFILLYRRANQKLTPNEIKKTTAITSGLWRMIDSMQRAQQNSHLPE